MVVANPKIRSAAGMDAAPVDLFVDAISLLTTLPQPRRGQVRSLPVAGGVAPRRVWSHPIGPDLPSWLAALLSPDDPSGPPASTRPLSVTPRALAVMELVATCVELSRGFVVPAPARLVVDSRWRWEIAPDQAAGQQLSDALAAVVAAGAVLGPDPTRDAQRFADSLAGALVPDWDPQPLLGPVPKSAAQRAAALMWADHVKARRLAGARMALHLNPPEVLSPSEAPNPSGVPNPSEVLNPSEALSHPEAPGPSEGANAGNQSWSLQPLAVKLDEPTTRVPVQRAHPQMFYATDEHWRAWQATEGRALKRAWGPRIPLPKTLASGRTTALEPAAVLEFLDVVAPRLVAAGFDVLAPDGLLRRSVVRRRLRTTGGGTGELAADRLGLAAEVQVDGQTLTDAEYLALAAAKSELVSIRGRWVRVADNTAAALRALAERLTHPTSMTDLLVDAAFDGVELAAEQVLPNGLRPARPVIANPLVQATLRPYQLAGLSWLHWLSDNGIGGVLADDMGLGKTLQVLAWIADDYVGGGEVAGTGPTLVICPMTLVDTWLRQSAAFTPHLKVLAHHGGSRGEITQVVSSHHVVVTTYGILARDPELAAVRWHRVVLDEAQAIKNPDTRAAVAARALRADLRLAVTGTPVENHVGDLWSLLAFAQPGLLPRRKAFESKYLGANPADLSRLRAVVAPFVLRRAKNDPGILPDLPDREVIRQDANLTKEQIGAYEAVVADMLGALEQLRSQAGTSESANLKAEQLGRRATILGSITRLKQICVHPALLTETRDQLGGRSGKVEVLEQLCAQIVDEGQAVVIFTQFASFVPDLAAHLRLELGVEVATLTGSDSRAARAATVAQFSASDGPPILIASLKAGGTGLTLVRANHVIHLDRWWNPAVEDQASDRVWRIGQNQKVNVHILVCPGTLEDRIDAALASKRKIADAIVRSSDTAITELSDADLASLVQLVRERVLT